MHEHRFAIGQMVSFDRSRLTGPYEVVRILPVDETNSPTYRVKSIAEPFERTAREQDLVAVGLPPSEQDTVTAWPARRRT